jgi:hypothetical protein
MFCLLSGWDDRFLHPTRFRGKSQPGNAQKNPEKNAFFSLTSGLRCGRMTSPVKKGAFFVRRFFSRGGERSSR